MIRTAETKDTYPLAEMGAFMHMESDYRHFSYDVHKVARFIQILLETERGIVLVAENSEGKMVGGFIGEVAPTFYGDDLMGIDYSLFVLPEHRGGTYGFRLVKEFTERAIMMGAVHITSGTSTGVMPETTSRLYKKMGFTELGKLFHLNVLKLGGEVWD